jgi:hypothetical protein
MVMCRVAALPQPARDARRAALTGLIDYAGPFPPARLPIPEAAAEYERIKAGPRAWLVSRFACPAASLSDLATALRSPAAVPVSAILTAPEGDWRAGVLAQAAGAVSAASARADRLRLELIEVALPAGSVDAAALGDTLRRLPAGLGAFLEVPPGAPLDDALDALAAAGAAAKLRCGGLSAEQVPDPARVAAFLTGCAQRGLRAKATAGLHRPHRAFHADLGATTHGFLNVLAGAALALDGADPDEVRRAIAEEDEDALVLGPSSLRWRDRSLSSALLTRTRSALFVGLGSCSVDEPAEHLDRLDVLAA